MTADGLPVSLELSVQFHPDPSHLDRLHENIGPHVYRARGASADALACAHGGFANTP